MSGAIFSFSDTVWQGVFVGVFLLSFIRGGYLWRYLWGYLGRYFSNFAVFQNTPRNTSSFYLEVTQELISFEHEKLWFLNFIAKTRLRASIILANQ